MIPHPASRPRGGTITNYDDLFEDVMYFAKKKVVNTNKRIKIRSEEDLRRFLINTDKPRGSIKPIIDTLMDTRGARKIIQEGLVVKGRFTSYQPTRDQGLLLKVEKLQSQGRTVYEVEDGTAATKSTYKTKNGKVQTRFRSVENRGRFVKSERIVGEYEL